jgi:DNA invertase Pin-like site-specific DNA recombinase
MRLGYARCSTDEQAEALVAQVTRLRSAGCDRVIEELVSGGRNDREGLLEAMTLVRRGRVKALVITRVDRLGRDAAYADQLIALLARDPRFFSEATPAEQRALFRGVLASVQVLPGGRCRAVRRSS